MAGIYVHIPFCKSRCIYCGFFSTTSLERRDAYIDCVCQELHDRKDYLKGEEVDTIYFGGGTPSQLDTDQIARVLRTIYNIYNVRARKEITLEGNPDDLSFEFLQQIHALGINRLSMGIQSFDEKILHFLHRRHSAQQAIQAVEDARNAGFDNISIDLMFGFPGQTLDEWKRDVDWALQLPVQHLSAYSLMYDEGTVLANMLENGEIEEIDDELSLQMYKYLITSMREAGFEHYEISNFCRPGFHSRHNSSYWHGVPYLGVGAAAHSYDGSSRQYNVESLNEYMTGVSPIREELTEHERYNEFVFTGLRTKEGLSLSELSSMFGKEYCDFCLANAQKHIEEGRLCLMTDSEDRLTLTSSGIYTSNDIMSDLMMID